MTRKEQLLKIFEGLDKDVLTIVSPIVDDLLFVECRLDELKQYPFIKVNPKDRTQQKTTPAARLYKDLLSQEKEIVRMLCSFVHKVDAGESESQLRLYFKNMMERR